MSTEAAAQWLHGDAPLSIRAMFKELLVRHGHRAVAEAEMRVKDWATNQAPLVELLQNAARYGRHDASKSKSDAKKGHILAHYVFYRRWALRWVLSKARKAVKLREQGKSLQIKVHSFVKRAYALIGDRLVNAGTLLDCDDIYFLKHEEVGKLARAEDGSFDVTTVVATRREAFASDAELTFDDLHCGVPKPRTSPSSVFSSLSKIVGTPVSTGVAEGKARVVRSLDDAGRLKRAKFFCVFQLTLDGHHILR